MTGPVKLFSIFHIGMTQVEEDYCFSSHNLLAALKSSFRDLKNAEL